MKNNKINRNTYYKLTPTAEIAPRFYGSPKIHKEGNPLRPIIDNVGTVFYNLAKFLTPILRPLIGNTPPETKTNCLGLRLHNTVRTPPSLLKK